MVISPLFYVTLFVLFLQSSCHQCYSCTTDCKTLPDGKLDPVACDCLSSEFCTADRCFAKIDIFADEGIAIVQKGCVNGLPSGQDGCHYSGQAESIQCYCSDDKCNNKSGLLNYVPKTVPEIECCECNDIHSDDCSQQKCSRSCKGNYCLIDFDGIQQGCGLGIPRLQSFLRTNDYFSHQQEITCARYEATMSSVVHGCICATGKCNGFEDTREYQTKNVMERRSNDLNYCYSLQERSKKPFTKDVFRKSNTCEGQYCFISLTTSELIVESSEFEQNQDNNKNFVGKLLPKFEIMAGCLKVDNDEKVTVGCTTEFSSNQSNPISKHCICDSHLCNFYNLLTNNKDPLIRHITRTTESPLLSQDSVNLSVTSGLSIIVFVVSLFQLWLNVQ